VSTFSPGAAGALSFHDPFEGTEISVKREDVREVGQGCCKIVLAAFGGRGEHSLLATTYVSWNESRGNRLTGKI